MSNAYKGQTQYAQSPMGFYGGGYGGDPYSMMGGGAMYGGRSGGGFPTTFGGYGGGYGGYGQQSLVPQYQPTVNDLFSQYFSQQYYGGPAFNPFAATSLFGGGYGGGYGGGRGMGGRMRRRRQMFEDLFAPQQPTAQPEPMPQPPAQDFPYAIRRPTEPSQAAPQPQPAVQPYSEPVQPQYFGGVPLDFGYSAPVASAQPASPYMPGYQQAPMTADDVERARAYVRGGFMGAM